MCKLAGKKLDGRRVVPALMMGLAMAPLMAAPAFAAPETTNVTITGKGSEYAAYQLMTLVTNLKNPNCGAEDGHTHTEACYNYAYTVNPKYNDILKDITVDGVDGKMDGNGDGTVTQAEAMDFMAKISDKSDEARKFADAVYEALKSGGVAADKTSTDKTFAVDQGYYLIVETSVDGEGDVKSLVMLDTKGQENLTVAAKEGDASMVKRIVLTDGTTTDAVTVALGDEINYRLEASLPDKIADFKEFKMVFHDKIDPGLALNGDSITVKVKNGDAAVDVTGQVTKAVGGTLADKCSFEVTIADVKAMTGVEITKDTKVTVEYSCKVAEDGMNVRQGNSGMIDGAYESPAPGQHGNENTAHMTFTADPYDPTTENRTPNDKTAAFTFGVKVNKVTPKTDGSEGTEPLKGAEFTLYKVNADGSRESTGTKMTPFIPEGEGKTEADAVLFKMDGLNKGVYELEESKTPAGYITADPVRFEILADVNGDNELSDAPELNSVRILVYNYDTATKTFTKPAETAATDGSKDDGYVVTNVINVAGHRMPSTGGTGTYVLYACGGLLLAVGAGVLIVKRLREA